MTSAASIILARLDEIERQNQQVLALLAKMAGENPPPPQAEEEISVSRRMEIRQMAFEATRTPGKKKPSRQEARA
jgi:hypothetical protein